MNTDPASIKKETQNIISKFKNIYKILHASDINSLLIFNEIETFVSKVNLYREVHPDDDVRKECYLALNNINDFMSSIEHDKNIYDIYKKMESNIDKSGDPEDIKFIKNAIKEYETNGIKYSKKEIENIHKISGEITRMKLEFENNITNSNDVIKLKEEDLTGMSTEFLDTLTREDDFYIIPMQTSNINQILKYCIVQETRRIIDTKNRTRCKSNNQLLFDISTLQKQHAKLVDNCSYSDFILRSRMAQNSSNVNNFLKDIANRTRAHRTKQLEILRAHGFSNKVYDIQFYIEKVKQTYLINDNEIREYFVLDNVLSALFSIFEELMNISINEIKYDTWHMDVKTYHIYRNGILLGKFYGDFYSRENKFEGYACFPIIYKLRSQNDKATYTTPQCALICNFDAPINNNTFLTHIDVETLLHELGHVIHHTFGQAKYAIYSGSNTEVDFSETPSQVLENLAWDRNILKRISKHWKTGQPLSDATIGILLSSRLLGLEYSRQITYSVFDQELYGDGFSSCEEMVSRFCKIRKEIEGLDDDIGDLSLFSHLVSEYGGTYYAYLWSKVYADDIYNTLEKDSTKWIQYIDIILRNGGTISANDMMTNFLGRSPNNEAFLSLL